MLPHAAASVSMCGYNTALDILQTGTPAVFIPFDDGKEVEQSLRAKSLADLPSIGVVTSRELNGDALLNAVNKVIDTGPRETTGQGFDGADQSVRIAMDLLEQRL